MAKKRLNIYVACGAGVATSTVIYGRVEEICKANGIDAVLTKGTTSAIPLKENESDLILTAFKYSGALRVPHMSLVSFISGFNEEKTEQDLISLLKKLSEEE